MRWFSKVAFIFNVCFFVSMIGRFVTLQQAVPDAGNNIAKLNPLMSSVVVLGWLAIFVNLVFIIFYLVRYPRKRSNGIPKWIIYFNMISLPAQIIYYFLSN